VPRSFVTFVSCKLCFLIINSTNFCSITKQNYKTKLLNNHCHFQIINPSENKQTLPQSRITIYHPHPHFSPSHITISPSHVHISPSHSIILLAHPPNAYSHLHIPLSQYPIPSPAPAKHPLRATQLSARGHRAPTREHFLPTHIVFHQRVSISYQRATFFASALAFLTNAQVNLTSSRLPRTNAQLFPVFANNLYNLPDFNIYPKAQIHLKKR
jgi:hypothetical protein